MKKQTINSSAKETIQAIKQKNTQIALGTQARTAQNSAEHQTENRSRASKHSNPLTANQRKLVIESIIKRLLLAEMSQGAALKELRVNVLGLKQDTYAKLVGVSRKTISETENDKGNYSADILNKVFKPFGLKVGLVPLSPHKLRKLLDSKTTGGINSAPQK
ncbi:MAG: helix-turn-helix domain-containing protein [Psychromonas sp.]